MTQPINFPGSTSSSEDVGPYVDIESIKPDWWVSSRSGIDIESSFDNFIDRIQSICWFVGTSADAQPIDAQRVAWMIFGMCNEANNLRSYLHRLKEEQTAEENDGED